MSKADDACTTRRSLLADILALSSAAGASAIIVEHSIALADPIRPDEHVDAGLLALEAPILVLVGMVAEIAEEMHRLEKASHEAVGPNPTGVDIHSREWAAHLARVRAAQRANGYDQVEATFVQADSKLLSAIREIERIPARTFDGVRMKARLAEHGDADTCESIVDDLITIDKALRA